MANVLYDSSRGPLGAKPRGADWNSAVNTTPLVLQTEDATISYYLWIDSTGRLRVKSGVPTSTTDGTVVGTQS